MDELMLQAPSHITYEDAEVIFKKNSENIVNTLAELWNIKDNTVKKPENKWDEIRETCDAYDAEMEKFMKKIRQQQ